MRNYEAAHGASAQRRRTLEERNGTSATATAMSQPQDVARHAGDLAERLPSAERHERVKRSLARSLRSSTASLSY